MENGPSTWEVVPPTDELAQDADDVEENHFRRLYNHVLDYIQMRMDYFDEEINEAIAFIISSFRYWEGRRFSDIDFNREEMCLGYIFRYAPNGAGLARCRILEALDNCRELEFILKAKQLHVASLGCGPGNDAIGFCSAMSRSKFTGSLEICMADSVKGWLDYIRVALKLLRRGDYGDASCLFERRRVKLSFCQLAVPEHFSYHEYDVVLICKLISIMDFEDLKKFIQNLYSTVKESAFILLIDTPVWEQFWLDKFDILYLSDKGQPYEMRNTMWRFEQNDRVTSNAQIAVLRKRRSVF